MTQFVSLYDKKTKLSALVYRAPAGGAPRQPANIMRIEQALATISACQAGWRVSAASARGRGNVAPDFDAPDPRIEQMFGDAPG